MARRNTIQKALIAESLQQLCHPTAEEIWLHISKKVPSISRTTVYRNLNQMVEDQTVSTVHVDKGALRYDYDMKPHAHFNCISCDEIKDLPDVKLRVESEDGELDDYDIVSTEVLLSGRCPKCKGK